MTVKTKQMSKNASQDKKQAEFMGRVKEIRKSWSNGEGKIRRKIALAMQNQLLLNLAGRASGSI